MLCDPEINMVARDGNFYFRKTSLGTGFSAGNYLFDSRNCLLTSLILGSYYKLNLPKRASAVYWLLGTLLYPWAKLQHLTLQVINRKFLRSKMVPILEETRKSIQEKASWQSKYQLYYTICFLAWNPHECEHRWQPSRALTKPSLTRHSKRSEFLILTISIIVIVI